jgi:hypothetical protein
MGEEGEEDAGEDAGDAGGGMRGDLVEGWDITYRADIIACLEKPIDNVGGNAFKKNGTAAIRQATGFMPKRYISH